ncbi:hypothetical protein [Micromonospora sp. C41]|uniref:hypothetical protein n=1 Tax=Micromonospora sp. C41 TaxID=2824878 RepID=UPI001B35F1BD|nr:hypothetical protein [Micromonospora sp. C41]MBQ1061317.1 hypothetical protein [Micromonospora sp. C41]
MTEKPYTDADVQLVARTLWAECRADGPPTDTCREDARAVLDILARAGRLKPPTTEAQIRAGADALVRLRTLAPSLSELDAEDQAFWRRDAVAVLETAGQPPSDLVDRLAAALTAALGALTADPSGRYHTSGYIPATVVDGWRALLAEHACPCLPGAPTHRHGEGGYAIEQPDWDHQIVFAADGAWTIDTRHPEACPAARPCLVERLAQAQIPSPAYHGLRGRFWCAVNDLGDRFLIGDRVTDGSACCVSEPASDDTTMTAPTITIERPDDEHIEIHVNGEVIASANHDEHGWSGMDAVERTALAVARACRVRVVGAEGCDVCQGDPEECGHLQDDDEWPDDEEGPEVVTVELPGISR